MTHDKYQQFFDLLPRRAGDAARPFYALTNDERPASNWTDDEVRIFQSGTEIGAYKRPYCNLGAQTFEPFEQDGKWYALYSADETCTRVMSLPECRDIGGEVPSAEGFCPAEIYVPRYRDVEMKQPNRNAIRHWMFESEAEKVAGSDVVSEMGPWQSLDVGFVYGCFWACPFQLMVYNLSRASQGVLIRDDRFGDLQIPDYLQLASAIRLERRFPGPLVATIARIQERDVKTGRPL
ncbi:MAG: hypothetical protein HY243_11800 [Proteobacteria bacterium]|nr:hypothetical protein [Pseudomonadota bacterium]